MFEFKDLDVWKQKAIYLNVIQGHSGAEIGRRLGISSRTVTYNLRKYDTVFDVDEIIKVVEGEYPDFVESEIESDRLIDADESEIRAMANVLFYDIEVAPSTSAHFDFWGVNLYDINRLTNSFLLSHAWAWNDGDIEGQVLTPAEAIAENHKSILDKAWELFDKADVIVAHNGAQFDIKKMNRYWITAGYAPPSPYRVYDTMLVAKRKFKFDYNSLAHLAKILNVPLKLDSGGMDNWKYCLVGDKEALDKMIHYNKGDIDTLRGVYNKLLPWDNQGINMSLYRDLESSCPHCGSDDVYVDPNKFVYTAQQKYNLIICGKCDAKLRANTKLNKPTTIKRVV